MSDTTSEPEHTHVVVRKAVHRTNDGPGPGDTYEPGDPITPTEGELEAFGDRFKPLGDDDESSATDESSTDENDESGGESDGGTEPTEGTDADEDADDGEQAAENETLSTETVEDATRDELRSLAGDYDDVNGNWGTDRLRAELLAKVEDESE